VPALGPLKKLIAMTSSAIVAAFTVSVLIGRQLPKCARRSGSTRSNPKQAAPPASTPTKETRGWLAERIMAFDDHGTVT
jgi:hypothetical protein